jgi:hypothetical protein
LFLGELALPHVRNSPEKRTPSPFAWYGLGGAGQRAKRVHSRLTFEVRGVRKWAKPACGRPLD